MRMLPKAPQRLDGEIGMLGFWVPECWKILENVPRIIPKKYRKVVQNRSKSKEMVWRWVEKGQQLLVYLFQWFPGPQPSKNLEKFRKTSKNFEKPRKTLKNFEKLRKTLKNLEKPRKTSKNFEKSWKTSKNFQKHRQKLKTWKRNCETCELSSVTSIMVRSVKLDWRGQGPRQIWNRTEQNRTKLQNSKFKIQNSKFKI